MGLRDVVAVLAGERRAWSSTSLTGMGLVERSTYSGRMVYTGGRAEDLMRHSAVYACRNLLVKDISTLPVDVFRGRAEVDPPSIVANPSPEPQVAQEVWVAQLIDSAVMRGNIFGLVTQREPNGYPAKILPVSPDEVECLERPGKPTEWRALGARVELFELGGDLWHVPFFPPAGKVLGLSPLEYARTSIMLGRAAEGFGAGFFDAPQPSGVLSIDVPEVTDDQAKTIKRRFRESVANREPVVLSKVTDYKPLSIKPEESQFLQTIAANDGQIARFYGVPAAKIGAASAAGGPGMMKYSNIEQDQTAYYVDAVRPLLEVLERAWSRLIPGRQRVKFNPEAILRVDTRTRYDAHASAITAGWMTPNEVREIEDMPKADGGDTLRLPTTPAAAPAPTTRGVTDA